MEEHNDRFSLIRDFIINADNDISLDDKHKLVKLIKPAISIKTNDNKETDIAIGKSKIGGRPDLPKIYEWPTINHKPLIFCAQFNFSELNEYDKENELPKQGMLYVFLGLNKEEDWFSYDITEHSIFCLDNIYNLERKEYPLLFGDDKKIQPEEVTYSELYTIPDDENYKLTPFGKKYKYFYSQFYQETEIFIADTVYPEIGMHQILGEDRAIQSSVVYEFARTELKIEYEEYSTRFNEILEKSKDYRLLIQLDCNESLSKYGGSGVIYIGIRNEDLKKHNFTNLSYSLQQT